MQDAADQVMDLIFGRWRSQTLSAGTELGVFDHLNKDRAKKAETLATELDVDPALLYRLLRAQAAIGLLEEDASQGFVLTDKGDLLRSDHPQSLKPMVRLEEGPQHYATLEAPAGNDPGRQAECVHPRVRSHGVRPRAGEPRLRRAIQTSHVELLGGPVLLGSGSVTRL